MNAQETLPTELRMAAPPSIPQARSYMFKQRSEYTEYDMGKGSKIRINIPRLQRTYLSKDSYLRFRLNLDVSTLDSTAKSAPLFLDRAGAYSLFDRMEVYDYMGGTLIEQVNNIPALVCMLNDINCTIENFNSKLQSTQGFEGSMIGIPSGSLVAIDGYEIRTANSGQNLIRSYFNAGGTTNAVYATFEFAIPLLSFLGNFSSKFVPLHNGFSIDLFLNNPNQAFVCYGLNQTTTTSSPIPPATNKTFANIGQLSIDSAWITNMEFCAQVMELGNDAENLVLASNGSGPLVIPSVSYRYFTDLIKGSGEADQTSTYGMDLNLNVVSLRNIRFGMRPAKWQNALQYPAYGHRIRNFLESFSFRYGSSFLPELAGVSARSTTLPVSRKGYSSQDSTSVSKQEGFKQAYAELLKTGAAGFWPSPSSQSCSITPTEYQTDLLYAPYNADASQLPGSPLTWYDKTKFENVNLVVPPLEKFGAYACGKFEAGLDLRLSSKDVVSGMDTNGLLVRLNTKFDDDNLVNMVNAVLDVYAEYDSFVQIIPGVATTVTF